MSDGWKDFLSWITVVGSVVVVGVWNNNQITDINNKIFEMNKAIGSVEGQLQRISFEGQLKKEKPPIHINDKNTWPD